MSDRRIAYGVNCTWWDSIDKVGVFRRPDSPARFRPSPGLPCCPNCGSVLMEVPDEESWFRDIDEWEKAGEGDERKGYRRMMEWARGRCFPDMARLKRMWTVNEALNASTPGSGGTVKP